MGNIWWLNIIRALLYSKLMLVARSSRTCILKHKFDADLDTYAQDNKRLRLQCLSGDLPRYSLTFNIPSCFTRVLKFPLLIRIIVELKSVVTNIDSRNVSLTKCSNQGVIVHICALINFHLIFWCTLSELSMK